MKYRKILKTYFSKALFEGLILGEAYIRRSLSMEGNLHFKIDWASLKVGSKFIVFALFYFAFEGNFPSTSPRGRDNVTDVFFVTSLGGLYLQGLFLEFYSI